MRKTFKHLAMAALASALIAGQATTAFAFKNDTNNGPGSGKSTEVSLQAPGDNSDSSQSSGNNTSPTTIVEESSQSTDTSQSETSQTTETTTETTTDTTTAAETVTEDTSAQVPTNLFRATQTEAKLRRENIQGKQEANKTHFEVGKKVRDTIKDLGGTMPEDLPTPEKSIQQLEREQKKKLK